MKKAFQIEVCCSDDMPYEDKDIYPRVASGDGYMATITQDDNIVFMAHGNVSPYKIGAKIGSKISKHDALSIVRGICDALENKD